MEDTSKDPSPVGPELQKAPVIIFGAAESGLLALEQLKKRGETIVAFIDNDTKKQGREISGIPVLPPSKVEDLEFSRVVLASLLARGMWLQLVDLGVPASKIEIFNMPSLPDDDGEWLSRHAPGIEALKNRHQGEDCFILGNGPSLLETDLGLLRDFHVFGLNKIHLLFDKTKLHIDYHVAINRLVLEQSHEIFSQQSYMSFLCYNAACELGLPSSDNRQLIYTTPGHAFSRDACSGISGGSTVTYVALQIAYYMGFQNVFLIGVDHRFKVEGNPHETQTMGGVDVNHFDPNYFANMKWNLPDLEGSELSYQQTKIAFENSFPQRSVFDATFNGALQVFPKISYEEAVRNCRPKRYD